MWRGNLSPQDAGELRDMARSIAVLLFLGPRTNADYVAAK